MCITYVANHNFVAMTENVWPPSIKHLPTPMAQLTEATYCNAQTTYMPTVDSGQDLF